MPNPEHTPSVISSQTRESQHKEMEPALSPSQKAFWHKVEAVIPQFADITDLSQVKDRLTSLLAASSVTPETFATSSRRKQERLRPEIFALAGKAVELVTGLTPYETQYVTAQALTENKIAELPSGEGKTIATGIAAVFKALTRESVHVITANDYLARRDLAELGEVYAAFGLKSGVIFGEGQDVMRFDDKTPGEDPINFPHLVRIPFDQRPRHRAKAHQQIYQSCNIIYGTGKSLIFDEQIDTLTTNLDLQRRTRLNKDGRVPIKKAAIIVDEVDDLAINKARTPQILSNEEVLTNEEIEQLRFANNVVRSLEPPQYTPKKGKKGKFDVVSGDYEVVGVNSEHPWVKLTENGMDKVLLAYLKGSSEFFAAGSPLPQLIQNALNAHAKIIDTSTEPPTINFELYKRGRNYIVVPDTATTPPTWRLVLIDTQTGRPLPDNILSAGMHQALEAKEGFRQIHGHTQVFASNTIQSWLRSYDDLSGTTGTAHQSVKLFRKFYKKEVEIIPPHRPSQLERFEPKILFSDELTHQLVHEVLCSALSNASSDGKSPLNMQPFLIAAASDNEAESIYKMLQNDSTIANLIKQGELHLRQLTASNLTDEANFIAQAGKKNTITISTAIAGRGTHIELGGKKPTDTNGKVLPKESPEYQNWQKDHDDVVSLGGLFVLAATIPPTQRELEQLAKRAARNGDPGSFAIIASIHSPLFVEYGETTHNLASRIQELMQPKTSLQTHRRPFERFIRHHETIDGIIADVQKSIEDKYADSMEELVHTDNVYQHQRKVFVQTQEKILQHTDEWLKNIPNFIRQAVHTQLQQMQRLSFDELLNGPDLDQHINDALTIKDQIGDQTLEFPLTTVTDINSYLLQQASKHNRHFYPLTKMSFAEQEQAIIDFLIQRFDTIQSSRSEKGFQELVQIIAQRTLQGFWQQHLEELDEMLTEDVGKVGQSLPYAVFANDAHERLTKHLTTLQLAILQQLSSAEVTTSPNSS